MVYFYLNSHLEKLDLEFFIKNLGDTIRTLDEEIKNLEHNKRVYHSTSDTLIKIQMFEKAVEQLVAFAKNHILSQQVSELMNVATNFDQYFSKFSMMPKIKELHNSIMYAQEKYKSLLSKQFSYIENNTEFRGEKLKASCMIVQAIGSSYKKQIIDQFCKDQLSNLQKQNLGVAKIQEVFSWLRRRIQEIASEYLDSIPLNWFFLQELSVEFCLYIRTEITKFLKTSDAQTLHVLLKSTIKFEEELEVKFASTDNYNFRGLISSCFFDFMAVYIKWIESKLNDDLERAMKDEKFEFTKGNTDSTEIIFLSIQESFRHVQAIDKANTLLDVTNIWRSVLVKYGNFLIKKIPKFGDGGILSYLPFSPRDNTNPEKDINTVCYVTKLSFYCKKTIVELEKEVKGTISELLRKKASFQKEIQFYQQIYDHAIDYLTFISIKFIRTDLDGMLKFSWENIEKSKHESDYVIQMKKKLDPYLPQLKSKLSEETFGVFGKDFVSKFFTFYASYVRKIKKVSDNGVSQLAVDTNAISNIFKTLLCVDQTFEMGIVLKILQAKKEKIYQAYLELEKRSLEDFTLFLDMTGTNYKQKLIEMYKNEKN